MFRGSAGGCLLLVLSGASAGCASHPRPQVAPVNQHAVTPPKTTWPAPAWVARFSAPTRLTTCTDIDAGRLCAGELGERWLESGSSAVASPYLAPETLVAALPTASHRFIFVGRRGTRYLSESPLGPFSTMQTMPQRFESYQVIAGRWFGLNAAGELWRGAFDDTVGSRVDVPASVFEFAMAPGGKGLAANLPESLWWTDDAGEHWRLLDTPPVGTRSISLDEHGRLRVLALLPDGARPLQDYVVSDVRKARSGDAELRVSPAQSADVRALDEGRAVFVGREWLALAARDNTWYLNRGHFDEPLRSSKANGLNGCQSVKLAARGTALTAFCQRRGSHPNSDRIEVLTASLENLNFKALGAVQGQWQQLHAEPLDDKRLLATGVCAMPEPLQASTTRHQLVNTKSIAKCVPQVPAVMTLGAKVSVDAVQAPGARLAAPPLAVSDDGQLAAFVARSAVGAAWQLYLSTDAGRSFSAHAIDALPATGAGAAPARSAPGRRLESRVVQSLNFGEDRSLALVLRDSDAPFTYNFDDRGQLIATSMAPPEVSRLDAVGSRILAVSLTQRNVYQSLDRGASFELVGHLPAPACLTYTACPVICRKAGCLIGERFTRVSWGAGGAEPLDIAGNPEQKPFDDEPPTVRVSFRTSLVCDANAKKPSALGQAHPPTAEQLSVGEVLWYAPWQDPARANAGLHFVRRGWREIFNLSAFDPTRAKQPEPDQVGALPGDAGQATAFDDYGLVFLRSAKVPKLNEPLGELDVASFVFRLPHWVHARFRDEQAITNQDFYLLGPGNARRLLPAALSATPAGVFVQPHAQSESVQFVTQRRSMKVERVPWPIERVREEHWSKAKDNWVVYALDETGSVLLRATKPIEATAAHWDFAARTVVSPRALLKPDERVHFQWGGVEPALILANAERPNRLKTVTAYRLTSGAAQLGENVAMALPDSLGEPPPICSATDRISMLRVVLPLLPQAARAVQIQQGQQPTRWLVATRAVMYARVDYTCIDALWAETLPGTPAMTAVIPLDKPTQSAVFQSQGGQLQAVPAQCHFDVHAAPPPEYETRLQVRWNLDHLPLDASR